MNWRVVAATALSLAACAATPEPASNEARSVELAKVQALEAFAEPCSLEAPPNPPLPPDAPEPPPKVGPDPGPFTPSIFLDTALFLLPTARAVAALPAARQSLARDPSVRLLGTPHLSAPFDAKTHGVLEDHTGPLAQVSLHELSATPTRAEGAAAALELEIVLQLPTAQATGSPSESRIRFLSAPRFGQAVALTAEVPEQPGQSLLLLLTPYSIRAEADLRAIFMCKMAQRQRALATR